MIQSFKVSRVSSYQQTPHGYGPQQTNLSKWGYAHTADTACECGTSEQTMQHLLRCPLLNNECSLEDLATANEKALHCARAWPNIWLNSEMMDTKEEVIISTFKIKHVPDNVLLMLYYSLILPHLSYCFSLGKFIFWSLEYN